MVLRPWKFSPQTFFSRKKKVEQKQQGSAEKSLAGDQYSSLAPSAKTRPEKQQKEKFRFRRWHPRRRKRNPLFQQQCRGPENCVNDSSSCLNYGSSSFECETSTASNELDDGHRVSSLVDYENSVSNTDFDNSVSTASDNDFFLGSSKLNLYNHFEVNPLEMYLHSRHERAMVRLCALLWILKLEEDRSQRRSEAGSSWDEEDEEDDNHHQNVYRHDAFDKVVAMDTDSSSVTSPRRWGNRSFQVVK